jgi:hypothetical protein
MVGIGVMELLVLVGLGLFIYRWRSRRAANLSRPRMMSDRSRSILISVILGSILLLGLAWTTATVREAPRIAASSSVVSADHVLPPLPIHEEQPVAPGAADARFSTSFANDDREISAIHAVPKLAISTITLLIVLILVLGFVFSSSRHSPSHTSRQSDDLVNTTASSLRWSWLIIPLICFLFLGYRVVESLTPSPLQSLADELLDFPQRHERMLKTAREFVNSQPSSEIGAVAAKEWITDGATGELEANRLILVSGQFSSVSEAETELMPIVANLAKRSFHQEHPWQGDWTVPLATVRERVVENEFIDRKARTIGNFSGDLFRLYMLVNLSPDVLSSFESEWKSQIVERRLARFGLMLGWIVSQLFVGWAYFRCQGGNPHPGRWRWKVLAILISIGLTACADYVLNQLTAYFAT